jgi:hypothetical protein
VPSKTKALLTFAGRFLLIFVLALPLWFLITPAYNRLLASSVNFLLPLSEEPQVTTLVGWKHFVLIVRRETPVTNEKRFQGFNGYLTHFNLILMVALMLAPRQVEWRQRWRLLAIALGSLYVAHIVYLLIGVKYFQEPELEAFQSPTGRIYVWGVNFYLSVASQLLPVLLWMALFRMVSGIPGRQEPGSQPPGSS